jgi:hypothetical protein
MIKPEIDILSYVKTILISLAVAMLFSCVLIYFAQLDVINHSSSRYNEKILRDYIKNTVIIQNEDLEMQYPDDYRIDIHLGYLNQVIEDYAKAESIDIILQTDMIARGNAEKYIVGIGG